VYFLSFYTCCSKTFTRPNGSNLAWDNILYTNVMNVRLYSCLSYPTCKLHLFCISLYSRSRGACLAVPYFSTLSHKQRDCRKNCTENKMRVLIFSTAFYWNIFHSEINLVKYYHKRAEVFTKIPFNFVRF
jgi:hypothetical protein